MSNALELKYFSRKPKNFDYSEYNPVRVSCGYCGFFQVINRAMLEKYHDYDCMRCGCKNDGVWVIPDGGEVYFFDGTPKMAHYN